MIPCDRVITVCKVIFVEDLEADFVEGGDGVTDGAHTWDAVAILDFVGKFFMLWDGRVPVVGHAPFVDAELFSKDQRLISMEVREINAQFLRA